MVQITLRLMIISLIVFGLHINESSGQGAPDYLGGMKVTLTPDGSKYFRIVAWGQIWARHQEQVNPELTPWSISVRRTRILLYYQLNKRFLLLSHFGLNGLNSENLTPNGQGSASQLFLHGLWSEYTLIPSHLYMGAGLHYWNGLSRLNSQSSLNMMTLDNHRSSWASLGLSDQFGRHLGIYLKGSFGQWAFRFAVNDAMVHSLDEPYEIVEKQARYRGRELLGKKAQWTYGGYVEYFIGHRESTFLPYRTGSYLGSQKVITMGAGFFSHPNGTVTLDGEQLIGQNVFHYNIDCFIDFPIRFEKQDAITYYLSFARHDYGVNYLLQQDNSQVGTGTIIYSHLGYVLPKFSNKGRLQPYVSFSWRDLEALETPARSLGLGANWYIHGHHAKLTLAYEWESAMLQSNNESITLQAMVYL